MRKISAVFCLLWVCAGSAAAQPKSGQADVAKVPTPQPHYQPEYAFDLRTEPGAWSKQKPGLHAAFGSTDELYLRSEAPSLEQNGQGWEATGWRGERLNVQALVWSPDTLEQVRFRVGGNSSIQFEKLREGIVDYEKIRILRKLAAESSQGNARDLMKEFETHLCGFMSDRDHAKRDYDAAKMTEAVQKGRAMIETLSNALGK